MADSRKSGLTKKELDAVRREAIEFAGIGLYRYKFDGTVAYMDRMARCIFDLADEFPEPSDVKGRNISSLFTCIEPEKSIRLIIRESGHVRGLEYPFRTLAGKKKWALLDSYLVRDSKTKEMEIQTIVRDITERKQIEMELRKSEERFRDITENAQEWIWEVDAEGKYTYSSPIIEKILGYKPEEMLNSHFYDFFHPDDRANLKKRAFEAFAKKEPFREFTNRNIRKNGKIVWLSTSGVPLIDNGGELVGYRGMDTDITERMRWEVDLRRSEEKYRELVNTSVDAVISINVRMKIIVWNPGAERIFGYKAEDILGKSILTIVPERFRNRKMLGFAEFLKSGAGPVIGTTKEFIGLKKDGTEAPLEITVSVRESEGNYVATAIIRDVTERRQAEEERRRLQAQMQRVQKLEGLGVLAGGVAHDFNNLLTGILGNASLALMEAEPGKSVRSSIEQIEKAALRAAELTNQMLAYSGGGRFILEPIYLSELIKDTTHFLEASISKKAALSFDFDTSIPTIKADPIQIQQVIMNLVMNASEALCEKGGVITLRTGVVEADRACLSDTYLDEDLPEGCYVFLEVADTGCGMEEEILTKIFDPFFTTKFTGRGLGLAAALGIIRGHSGAIKVSSKPGRGSAFKIFFPCSGRLPKLTVAGDEKVGDWRGAGAILVVDDEEFVRNTAKRMLMKFGFHVLVADGGEEGIRIFRRRSREIVAVLLDLTMGKMDGKETFTEMRRIRPGVRVVLSSGYNEQEATNRFAGEGLAGFIQKPYRVADLIEKLKEILGS